MSRLYDAVSLVVFVLLFVAVLTAWVDEAGRQEYPGQAVAYSEARS